MSSSFHPLVSIVIPVYNGSNYLREAIDSALAQTYDNIEIIIVNDGSKDEGATEAIALSYGDKIRYFAKENGGTSTALNVGLRNMKGEYFSWLSHDDMYYPDKIKREVEVLSGFDNKLTVMMTDLDGINEKYEKIYQTSYQEHINEYPARATSNIYPVIYMKLHGCTLLIPRVCFESVGYFDETSLVAQDFEMFRRIFEKYPSKLINEVLVTARDSSNRQGIRSKTRGSLEYSELFISIIESLTEDDIAKLAPSRLVFLANMRDMYAETGYIQAYNYVSALLMSSLQVNYTDCKGGNFNGYDLHLALRKRGYEGSQIVFKKESSNNTVTQLRNAIDSDAIYDLVQVLENNYSLRSFISPLSYDILFNKLYHQAEIVHYHIIHHPAFNLHIMPILTMLKPSVWTLHDTWALTGHCVHPDECEKWQSHCHDCEHLQRIFAVERDTTAVHFEMKKQLIQRSNIHCVVASEWMADRVRKSPIFAGKKVTKIPFGVDQCVFKPLSQDTVRRELGIASDDFVVLARTQSVFKGLDVLIDALQKLRTTCGVTVLCVGEFGLLNVLSDKIKVKDLGWIDTPAQMAKLYNACDLFLMPSEQEAFGMMAIEAMSCGKLVLALRGTALPEVINAPLCGIAVDKNEYAGELQRLYQNPDEIGQRGVQSLAFAQKEYNYTCYVNRMIDLYRNVIADFTKSESSELILDQLRVHTPRYGLPGLHLHKGQIVSQDKPRRAVLYCKGVIVHLKQALAYYRTHGAKSTFKKIGMKVGKIGFYFKHNGLKETLRKIMQKLSQ